MNQKESRNRNLLILGAGQYGTVVREIAEELGFFQKISFLDDCHGKTNSNYHEETIGSMQDYNKFKEEYAYAIPAIGNAGFRMNLFDQLENAGFEIPVLVSPRAYVSLSADLGKGVVIEPLAGVHANAVIGKGSYISMGATVNHNAVIAEGCHIDNNAVVMSGAKVLKGTTTEPCAVILRGNK